MKPTLCLDFDGVIHSYSSGWKGAAVIPDAPVPGAMEFIVAAVEHFQVDIFSSRSADPLGRRAMWSYIKDHLEKAIGDIEASRIISLIDFPFDKPAAFISIDDRALTFEGKWPDVESLLTFKPWNKRPTMAKRKRTVTDILCMANASAEFYYAGKCEDEDWPLIQEALERCLIRFIRYEQLAAAVSSVVPSNEPMPIDTTMARRTVYKLTSHGAGHLAGILREARA